MHILMEINGREEGAGVLQLMIYETQNIFIPDPRVMSHNDLSAFNDLFSLFQKHSLEELQEEIDTLILEIFGRSISREKCFKILTKYRNRRIEKRK